MFRECGSLRHVVSTMFHECGAARAQCFASVSFCDDDVPQMRQTMSVVCHKRPISQRPPGNIFRLMRYASRYFLETCKRYLEAMTEARSLHVPSVTPRRILTVNTVAFGICFAIWMLYAALIKHLSNSGTYAFTSAEEGVLLAVPVLTGAVLRLPVGVLTDKLGGRPVFTGVLVWTGLSVLSVSLANGFYGFLACGLAFGVAGASFAAGVAYTAVWFKPESQGTALGIFGAGNAGAAVTLLLAPPALEAMTAGDPEGWRWLPVLYSGVTLITAAAFWALTENRTASGTTLGFLQRLRPLKNIRVWRFGLYYFLVFGAFVGLSGWLVKYYVDVYHVSLATAGMLASGFSLPSSIVRIFGGWLSDRFGARTIMYWVLGFCSSGFALLALPLGIVPFTIGALLLGIAMGIGMAAVYKHIPAYFPREVGVVGGIVGVMGGLGGFVCPVIFGWLLTVTTSKAAPTGWWNTSWIFLTLLSLGSLLWMHLVVRQLKRQQMVFES